jgi:hypothetical protein
LEISNQTLSHPRPNGQLKLRLLGTADPARENSTYWKHQKKIRKSGVFLGGEKMAAKHHEFAHIHHTFTTNLPSKKHQNPQNPLKNYPFASPIFFLPSASQN